MLVVQQQLVDNQAIYGNQDILIHELLKALPEIVLEAKRKPNKLAESLKNIAEYTPQVA